MQIQQSHLIYQWRIIAYPHFDYLFIYLCLSNHVVANDMNIRYRSDVAARRMLKLGISRLAARAVTRDVTYCPG